MRSSLLFALLGATSLLTACDIPSATFNGSTSGGSTATAGGGSGGDTTSTTTTPMHTTSSSGGGGTGGTTTTGGTGGSQGGSTTTTTTTTTSTGGGPTVPCGYPEPVMECDPGQVCCFEKVDPDGDGPLVPTDVCGASGDCVPPAKYSELRCNENADCANGKICCAYYAQDPDLQYRIQSTFCKTSCDGAAQEIKTCSGADPDCGPVASCENLFGSAYPDYNFCIGL